MTEKLKNQIRDPFFSFACVLPRKAPSVMFKSCFEGLYYENISPMSHKYLKCLQCFVIALVDFFVKGFAFDDISRNDRAISELLYCFRLGRS